MKVHPANNYKIDSILSLDHESSFLKIYSTENGYKAQWTIPSMAVILTIASISALGLSILFAFACRSLWVGVVAFLFISTGVLLALVIYHRFLKRHDSSRPIMAVEQAARRLILSAENVTLPFDDIINLYICEGWFWGDPQQYPDHLFSYLSELTVIVHSNQQVIQYHVLTGNKWQTRALGRKLSGTVLRPLVIVKTNKISMLTAIRDCEN